MNAPEDSPSAIGRPQQGILPPPLLCARFDCLIAAPCPSDWRICVGLRGFLGHRLDDAAPELRTLLLPLFHEDSGQPAPFRLALQPPGDLPAGHHRIRMTTFGTHAERLLQWFANLLADAKGSLQHQSRAPFHTLGLADFSSAQLHFPSAPPTAFPRAESAPIALQARSPLFSKADTSALFAGGAWTRWLAIRYADLAGIPRKSLTAPPIHARQERHPENFRLALGGRRHQRTGHWFSLLFTDPAAAPWIGLLFALGIGQHTAYGAGDFQRVEVTNFANNSS